MEETAINVMWTQKRKPGRKSMFITINDIRHNRYGEFVTREAIDLMRHLVHWMAGDYR